MEQQLIKKRVRIILIGDHPISYNGVIQTIDDSFITLIDIKGDSVSINKAQISQIIHQIGGNKIDKT